MFALLEIALSNAIVASLLAVFAFAVGRMCRRPALTHSLWLLVLLKLLTPPIIQIPIVNLSTGGVEAVTVTQQVGRSGRAEGPFQRPRAGHGDEIVEGDFASEFAGVPVRMTSQTNRLSRLPRLRRSRSHHCLTPI